jgi:hypothetical protein
MKHVKRIVSAIACLFATLIIVNGDVPAVEATMKDLVFQLDGQAVAMQPGPRLDGDQILVPLNRFAEAVGAEAKVLENGGPLAVCRDDLCIPLNGTDSSTVEIEQVLYARLGAFGEPLGLRWEVSADTLRVRSSSTQVQAGLGIGDMPPAFSLPDLYTGRPVSNSDYKGKKTVFYMWASW